MKRTPIPDEIYQKLLAGCIYGGPGPSFFEKEIGPYGLTEVQIDELMDRLMNSHTAALEYCNAQEAVAFLKTLKNRD